MISSCVWPSSRLPVAIGLVAERFGVARKRATTAARLKSKLSGEHLTGWLIDVGEQVGVELEPVSYEFRDIDRYVRRACPAIVSLGTDDEYLVILGRHWNTLTVIAPNLSTRRIRVQELIERLRKATALDDSPSMSIILSNIGINERQRAKARRVVNDELRSKHVEFGGWLIRLPPGTGIWEQLVHAKVPSKFAGLLSAHVLQYLMWLGSWWLIGRGALSGRVDAGMLAGWAVLLLTIVPLRLYVTAAQGRFAMIAGGLLKKRLLYGALRSDADENRLFGSGVQLGRVIESETLESLAMNGGMIALISLVELFVAAWVLFVGAGGALHVLLFAIWMVLLSVLSWRYYELRKVWTANRLDLTHRLIENMVGHQTRLAQEDVDRWHDGEDERLYGYERLSYRLDRQSVLLELVPRGWLFIGIAGLMPAFIFGQASLSSLAIGLGAVLLVFQSLVTLTGGLVNLVAARVAWGNLAALLAAAACPPELGVINSDSDLDSGEGNDSLVLDVQNLTFQYTTNSTPVLADVNLQIERGDKVRLTGESGSGKSTLVSTLTGLRTPTSGLVLAGGLDRNTLGSRHWRSRVLGVPQFHENFVVADTLAFNLLMGRGWPPTAGDIQDARTICEELGLGDLLDRMPGGLWQLVGETGWQLSHGERSRIYIGRALLQEAELLVLDESFASLDPKNLERALRYVIQRAPSLLVIAHP